MRLDAYHRPDGHGPDLHLLDGLDVEAAVADELLYVDRLAIDNVREVAVHPDIGRLDRAISDPWHTDSIPISRSTLENSHGRAWAIAEHRSPFSNELLDRRRIAGSSG